MLSYIILSLENVCVCELHFLCQRLCCFQKSDLMSVNRAIRQLWKWMLQKLTVLQVLCVTYQPDGWELCIIYTSIWLQATYLQKTRRFLEAMMTKDF